LSIGADALRYVLFAAALAVAPVLHAQSSKTYRVGIVSPLNGPPEQPTVRAFRQGLRELGYIEGKNVIVEVRYVGGRVDSFPMHFADLIKLKVDVIVTGSGPGILAAKNATATVPIVFAGVLDPVSSGIVANLARPGGNVTGTTFGAGGSEIAGKWVELLATAVPRISRLAVLTNRTDPQSELLLKEIQRAAASRGIKVEHFDARSESELDAVLAKLAASGTHGMIVTNSPIFGAQRVKLVQFAAEKRLPAIYFFNLFPDSGGLMSYGGSLEESYRRAALYVDRVLRGAKPGELPVDQPTRFELVINLKAARALGIEIPRALLLRADRVID
jgi:putative ABC transport system substrate-binding protein